MGSNVKVVAWVKDLIFRSKIQELARVQGAEVSFVRNLEKLEASLQADEVACVVLDLEAVGEDLTRIPARLATHAPGALSMGFCSHVNKDLLQAAVAAGVQQVLPRSKFEQQFSQILAAKHP